MEPALHLVIDQQESTLSGSMARIEDFLAEHGAGSEVQFRIQLALDELVTNVLSYGGGEDGPAPTVRIDLGIADSHLICEIRDDGVAFNPLDVPPPDTEAALEDRNIGGLGIHFVRQMFPDLRYRNDDGENVLRLTCPLQDESDAN